MLPEGRSYELSLELLQGAIDLHCHATPHLPSSPRRLDPIQAAILARDAGMQTLVLMDVFQMSTGVAWIVNRAVPDFKVYGGLILNSTYGGMNPRAVKTAIRYGDGAKFICFGTHSTYFQASREGRLVDGKFTPLSELFPDFQSNSWNKSSVSGHLSSYRIRPIRISKPRYLGHFILSIIIKRHFRAPRPERCIYFGRTGLANR